MPEPDPRWNLHRTPNPSEKSLSILIPQVEIKEKKTLFDAYLPGALFKDCPIIPDQGLVGDYGDFVFTDCTDADNKHLRYWFGANKTLEQANTPFRTTTWKGNHRWPPVLLGVQIIADHGSQRSFTVRSGTDTGTGFGPTYYDQVQYIPDVAEGTRFVKDEFLSPIKFNIPQTPVPIPTSVSYQLPGGINGNFPECLHGDIIIEPTITCSAQLVAGTVSVVGTTIGAQVFRATNFTDWSPYILSDTQELRDGVWYHVRIRVFPPPQPEAITSFN